MVSREKLKKELKKLIENYEFMRKRKYSEADVQTKLIRPLFVALGWDFESPTEVREEAPLEGKKADMIFSLGMGNQLVVENKRLDVDIHSHKDIRKRSIEQAIIYGHSTGVNCTILTNFCHIIFLDSQKEYDTPEDTIVWEIPYDELLTDSALQKLLIISKEGVKEGRWEKELQQMPKRRTEKRPVDEQLLDELLRWRKILYDDIKERYKEKYDDEKIFEIVQKILNRFVFIRKCESKNYIDKNTLMNLYHNFGKKRLEKLFSSINNMYDGCIFEKDECDKVTITHTLLREIVTDLNWSRENKNIRYDFGAIPSDILGMMYEKYLGYILSEEGISESKKKRKKEGIYYTPKYIVDYIVHHTLGVYLKEIKDPSKITILDPACGSGSFLVGAYEYLEKYYSKKGVIDYKKKYDIIKNNLFGVDKDNQAIEIARLNLQFKILEKDKKLPHTDNLKVGDSLVDSKAVAGRKAFKWKDNFKKIFESNGFDIVIGNPPYVKARDPQNKEVRDFINESNYFETPYKMWDLYVPFVERGIKLLRPDGVFSMIIPETIGVADYTTKLVEFIIDKHSAYQVDFFPDIEIFKNVGIKNRIIFVSNSTKMRKCKKVVHEGTIDNARLLGSFDNNTREIFRLHNSNIDFNFNNTIQLGNICYVSYGARFNSFKEDPKKFKKADLVSNIKDKVHTKAYIEGKFLDRYKIKKSIFVEWNTERCPKRLVRPTFPELYDKAKLVMSREKRVVALSEEGHICDNTIILGVPYYNLKNVENNSIKKYFNNTGLNRTVVEKDSLRFDLKYLMGILNSKLVRYFLEFESKGKLDSYPDDWKKIPIKDISPNKQKEIIEIVKEILTLNKKKSTEEEIKKLMKKIDRLVYKLYNLENDEIDIIENFFET